MPTTKASRPELSRFDSEFLAKMAAMAEAEDLGRLVEKIGSRAASIAADCDLMMREHAAVGTVRPHVLQEIALQSAVMEAEAGAARQKALQADRAKREGSV